MCSNSNLYCTKNYINIYTIIRHSFEVLSVDYHCVCCCISLEWLTVNWYGKSRLFTFQYKKQTYCENSYNNRAKKSINTNRQSRIFPTYWITFLRVCFIVMILWQFVRIFFLHFHSSPVTQILWTTIMISPLYTNYLQVNIM